MVRSALVAWGLLAGVACAQTYPMPTSLYLQNFNSADVLPSHWYQGVRMAWTQPAMPAGNLLKSNWTGSSFGTFTAGNQQGDPAVGAGYAGMATGDDLADLSDRALFTQAGIQVGCSLVGVPEIEGCGYQRFSLMVIWKDASASHNYYGVEYVVTHGRNGYVGWTSLTSNGVYDQNIFAFVTSTNGTSWNAGVQPVQQGFVPRFPGKAALASLLNNPNGLLVFGVSNGVSTVSNAKGTIAGLCGTDVDTQVRAALVKLQSSLTTKQDMTTSIPRCSGQDVESSGGGGTSVDHVGDAGPVVPSNVDFDGDGVADYVDVRTDATAYGTSGPAGSVMWANGTSVVPASWDMSTLGLGTMRNDQYSGLVLNWKKPAIGGPVSWFSTSIDVNPASSSIPGVGSALNTFRLTCRTLGTLTVVFWTMHGVLITFRQW